MNKAVLSAVVVALALLGGCATYKERHARVPTLESRSMPQVQVRDGAIDVPNSLVFFKGETDVLVRWQLPANSRYRFPENGIVIEGLLTDRVIREGGRPIAVILDPNQQEIVDCKRAKDGLEFTCLNRNTKSATYKYTVRVLDGDRVLIKDPSLDNGPW